MIEMIFSKLFEDENYLGFLNWPRSRYHISIRVYNAHTSYVCMHELAFYSIVQPETIERNCWPYILSSRLILQQQNGEKLQSESECMKTKTCNYKSNIYIWYVCRISNSHPIGLAFIWNIFSFDLFSEYAIKFVFCVCLWGEGAWQILLSSKKWH